MQGAIHRASEDNRGALEIALDGNRISQLQREILERPENYLRPICVREIWQPPDVDDDGQHEKLEATLVSTR